MPAPALPLAAILFEDGFAVDALLAGVGRSQILAGRRVGGVVQERAAPETASGCATLALRGLATDRVWRISQDLGPGSQGCRLDPRGLADCAQTLMSEVTAGLDLLILNRFGKAEAEGRGLREVIGAALARGIPVLTALRSRNLTDWDRFTEGTAWLLPPEPKAAQHWVDSLQRADRAVP